MAEHNPRDIHPHAGVMGAPIVATPRQLGAIAQLVTGRVAAATANAATAPKNEVPLHAFVEDHTAKVWR